MSESTAAQTPSKASKSDTVNIKIRSMQGRYATSGFNIAAGVGGKIGIEDVCAIPVTLAESLAGNDVIEEDATEGQLPISGRSSSTMSEFDHDIEIDTATGIKTEYRFDGKTMDIKQSQDVNAIFDNLADLRAASYNPKAVGRVAGQIPLLLYETWQKEFKQIHGVGWLQADSETRQRFIAAKMNSREYSKLRAWEGKI